MKLIAVLFQFLAILAISFPVQANWHAVIARKKAGGGSSTGYLGYSDETGSTDSNIGASPRVRALKVTAPNNGTLTRMRVYFSYNDATHLVRLGVYNDSSGNVGTLKATTAVINEGLANEARQWSAYYDLTAEGGDDLNISSGTTYWLAMYGQNGDVDYNYFTVTSGDAELSDSGSWSTFPTTGFTDSPRAPVIEAEYTY